jgi:sulfite exporter TauE/SafE
LNLLLAFITGLTTGGLSCLAVQGGLLASSLASQVEKDVAAGAAANAARPKRKKGQPVKPKARPQLALPIALFLAAKLAAYTLLGFLLGLVGSAFQLSPVARAVLQIAIGIYMVGAALRMLNVHPIFRFFVFEPPAFLRRKIRKTAAGNTSLATPLFLGLLTVLIPCGITQAMMAVALSTGSPLEGAALMFAFTLGTSPVFFTVAYFATRLGARLEKYFMTFVAVVMLVLGVLAIDTGLNLAGSPFSLTRAVNGLRSPAAQVEQPKGDLQTFRPQEVEQSAKEPAALGDNVVTVQVENGGYYPNVVYAKAEKPIQLRLVTDEVYTCAVAFVIPSLNVQELLDPTGEKVIDIPAQASGTKIPFSCSMGMFTGEIQVQ